MIKINIRMILPKVLKDLLREQYKYALSKGRSIKRMFLREYTKEYLIKDLLNAGIKKGDVLCVHSSLSKIGRVSGGAVTVVDSFCGVVGTEGTILMPALSDPVSVLERHSRGEYVDLRYEPSRSGAITEVFRTYPNVLRSSHPFASMCAWGLKKNYLTAEHEVDPKLCHYRSPLARFEKLGGLIVGIGIDIGWVSFYHVIEDTWDEYPIKTYLPPIQINYVDYNGKPVKRDIQRLNPIISRTRIEKQEWIKMKLSQYFYKNNIIRYFRCGAALSWIMDSKKLYCEIKNLAMNGITIYLTPEQWRARGRAGFDWMDK